MRPLDVHGFEAVVAGLGSIESRVEVVVSREKEVAQRATRADGPPRPSLYQPGRLGFHTDPPWSEKDEGDDVLALYCVEQDVDDGATLLIDMGCIESDFTAEEVDQLGRIEVAYVRRDRAGASAIRVAPVVARGRAGLTLTYMPWGVRRPAVPALMGVLHKFESYVRSRPVTSVRLRPSECLFIDNARALHGRGPLRPDSRRHLSRVHLRVPAADPGSG